MTNSLYLYQHLPFYIDPVAFGVGAFLVRWYSLMYVIAFGVVYFLLIYRVKNRELCFECKAQSAKCKTTAQSVKHALSEVKKCKVTAQSVKFFSDQIFYYLVFAFIGLLIGARLGEVVFYNFNFYLHHPFAIISPFDPVSGQYVGLYGMSYHGGLVGVAAATWLWCRREKINPIKWANFIAPAVPLGYFFGRLGNFLNGELYGTVTAKWWGMYFPGDNNFHLRHPSQIYEAFFEGLILFLILWPLRNTKFIKENALVIYLFGYVISRFFIEFFRDPSFSGGELAIGINISQLLTLIMAIISFGIFLKNKKCAMIRVVKEKHNSKKY